ncbi:hypothetical protein J6590_087860 [Homalodisca vitripennis]|nr:hypothetical protein J6590_087860 [Homalodisca vitripennis]
MGGYGERMRSYAEVAELFIEEFPNRNNPITRFTVARIVQRYNDTHSVKDRPKPGRAPVIDEEKSLMLCSPLFKIPTYLREELLWSTTLANLRLTDVAETSMKEAAVEAIRENSNDKNIAADFDGTWQKRGHVSINGVVTATSFDTASPQMTDPSISCAQKMKIRSASTKKVW